MSGRAAVIAVTSVSLEANIASGPGVSVICDQASRLVASLEAEIARGAVGIISFGIAGGLAPELSAGDWVVGSGVWAEEAYHLTDQRWARRLLDALPGAVLAKIAGADLPIATASDKRRLRDRTGAAAVDMESHIAGRIAAAHKIPFAICRTVIDAAHRDLPPAALVGLRDDGTPDVLAVSRSLVRRPGQLPALARIAVDAWTARQALRLGRSLLGAGLGCPYTVRPTPDVLLGADMLAGPHLRSHRTA
jgi:hopanoid-associated phosphorylase